MFALLICIEYSLGQEKYILQTQGTGNFKRGHENSSKIWKFCIIPSHGCFSFFFLPSYVGLLNFPASFMVVFRYHIQDKEGIN